MREEREKKEKGERKSRKKGKENTSIGGGEGIGSRGKK